ncbi:hypothetical protein J437_LFUL013444 [Ladona fulva]|uniref:C2H2-type domain-containing protein n=1 Tax=Ladona fulva TaxID=123851 RepID=A0A8K0P8Q9_LADFU|nr:hypothetical protein J437_LFUL013444 [Ladona fulva]
MVEKMFGKCSSGSVSSSGKLRLPSPVFAVPDRHLFRQPDAQRIEFGQNSGYSNDLNKPEFSQSNNPWMNGSAPGQSNRKERFGKPLKQKLQRPRNFYNDYKQRGRGSSSFYCDSCDRGFSTHEEFQYHCNNEHITCGLDGCTLSAHPKVVEKHQKIQHLSGLYLRLRSNSSKNPEDVTKWIAERKKNYPTRANVERRKEVEKERLERGETLEPDRRRFGRFGGRGQQRGMRGRGGKSIGRDRKPRRRHSQSKEGHVPRGKRGRGRGGTWKLSERISHQKVEKLPAKEEIDLEWEDKKGIAMFCGTAELFGIPLKKNESSDEEIVEDKGDFSDSEWLMDDGATKCEDAKKYENGGDADNSKPNKDSVVLNNALGLLIGTYGSDDSNSDEEDSKAEGKPPAKRVCLRDQSDNQQKSPTVTTLPLAAEKKTAGNSSASNTLDNERVNIEEESDGSAPEVECIKKGPIENVILSNKMADTSAKSEEDSAPEVECIKKGPIENVISTNKLADESVKGEEDSDSAPEVVSIKKVSEEEVKIRVEDEKKNEEKEVKGDDDGKKRVRRSRKRGRTRGERGGKVDSRKDLEEENEKEQKTAVEDEGRAMRERKQLEMNQRQRYPTLLEELLKDEIRRERNAILQCIRYVVENNFFDKVDGIPPKEVAPEENSLIIGDGKNKSLELHNVNELHSDSNGSDKSVMMTESVDGKLENAVSSSENNDCEMEEQNSCEIAGQKVCDLGKGNSHETESSLEGELKDKTELGSEAGSNTLVLQAVNDPQSASDCFRKNVSKSNKIDGKSSESSQKISSDAIEYNNSLKVSSENMLGVEERQSSVEINSAMQTGHKPIENTTINNEMGNDVPASSKSNDLQSTNNFCQNVEIISKERHNENSKLAVELDEGITEGHNGSISAEDDVKKPEFSSLKGSEDVKNTESLEEKISNVAEV